MAATTATLNKSFLATDASQDNSEDASVNEILQTVNNYEHENKQVLFFVCTSNTCRSPMAEGLAKDFVQKNNLPLEVKSFGCWSSFRRGPSDQGVKVLKKRNIDITSHRSTCMNQIDFKNINVAKIICMTDWHQRNVKTHMKQLNIQFDLDKIITLKNGRVPDPIGGPIEEYEEVFECLNKYVVAHVKNIVGLGYDPILDAESEEDEGSDNFC